MRKLATTQAAICTGVKAKLAEDVTDVAFDGSFGHHERSRNFSVR